MNLKNSAYYIASILVVCVAFLDPVMAQEEGIKLVVKVKHKGRFHKDAQIKIDKNGSFFDQTVPDESGIFSYIFDYQETYHVHFTAPGMATKTLLLDLTNVPADEKGILHDWEIGELTLFKTYEGMDVSLLDKPVGRIHYDESIHDFTIDYKYGASIEKEMKKLTKVVESEEKNEAIAEKAAMDSYNYYLSQGNTAFKIEKYENALTFYQKANNLLPNHEKAKQKIFLTDSIINREAVFKDFVLEGDRLFRNEQFVQAKDKYLVASDMKPNESYPKSQLAIVAQKLKEQEAKNNEFNNYMAVADAAYLKGNYEVASANYQKALNVNPDAALAQKKLTESETAIKSIEDAEIAKERKVESLIAESDRLQEKGQFELAGKKLNEALLLKPNDPSIKAEQHALLLEKSEADKEAEIAAKNQAIEYAYTMNKEKGLMADQLGNKKQAIYHYEKALAIKPEDKVIVSRLKALKAAVAKEAVASNKSTEKSANEFADLDKMDKKSDQFLTHLAATYPQGLTEKEYKEGNKNITKRIVVSGNKGVEYTKIQHSWGGVFYFKNGEPITEYIWQKEAK
ncbi:MAG: tetratricopeptide repeat protein [Salibacteraceae bacterium]